MVWKTFFSAFAGGLIGKIVGGALIAVCVLFGFGPERWAAWIAGNALTPESARVAFLLTGVLVLGLWTASHFYSRSRSHIALPETAPKLPIESIVLPAASGSTRANEMDAENPIARTKPHLPAYEIEKKLRVVDEFLGLLDSEIDPVIDAGPGLASNWWNGFKAPEHNPDYEARLTEILEKLQGSVGRLEALRDKVLQYDDIRSVTNPSYWNSAIPKVTDFVISYRLLSQNLKPDVHHDTFTRFMNAPRARMEEGVRELESWRNVTRGHLNDIRRALTE